MTADDGICSFVMVRELECTMGLGVVTGMKYKEHIVMVTLPEQEEEMARMAVH